MDRVKSGVLIPFSILTYCSVSQIKDGKLSVDACVEWTRDINKDDTAMINAAKEISESCASINDPDG